MTTLTDTFIEQFKLAEGSDTARLHEAIQATLAIEPQGGWVDSHRVGDVLVAEREAKGLAPNPDHAVSYGQHLFRQATYVCRYADEEGCYRLHAEPKCSKSCDKYRRGTHRANEVRPICPRCFVMVPCTGRCDCDA